MAVWQTTEKEQQRKELAAKKDVAAETADASEEVLYKIDIPANRYDMLCLEGIARALNIFSGRLPRVEYRVALPKGTACGARFSTCSALGVRHVRSTLARTASRAQHAC